MHKKWSRVVDLDRLLHCKLHCEVYTRENWGGSWMRGSGEAEVVSWAIFLSRWLVQLRSNDILQWESVIWNRAIVHNNSNSLPFIHHQHQAIKLNSSCWFTEYFSFYSTDQIDFTQTKFKKCPNCFLMIFYLFLFLTHTHLWHSS